MCVISMCNHIHIYIVNQVDLFPDRVVVEWINRLSVNVPQSSVAAAQLVSP